MKQVKYFCDNCKEEIDYRVRSEVRLTLDESGTQGEQLIRCDHLCTDCYLKLKRLTIKSIKEFENKY